VLVTHQAFAQPRYRATAISALFSSLRLPSATALNNRGHIAGTYTNSADNSVHGFVSSDTGVIDLGSLNGAPAIPTSLSDQDEVVGTCDMGTGTYRAFIYRGGRLTFVPLRAGGTSNFGIAINNSGDVLVREEASSGIFAVLWHNQQSTSLGSLGGSSTWPAAINESAQVVGFSHVMDLGPPYAFLYRDGTMTAVAVTSSSATDINMAGDIVGFTDLDTLSRHATLWRGGRAFDLGTLGGFRSEAAAINNRGVVVGQSYSTPGGKIRAFVYINSTMYDLNSLLDEPLPPNELGAAPTLYSAIDVNDLGQILVDGFLLTPVADSSRIVNYSARVPVQIAARAPILGFTTSNQTASALLRAVGPTLESYGVSDAAPDPRLELYRGSIAIGSNDNWDLGDTSSFGAFTLPVASRDAALLTTLDQGSYTFRTTSPGTGTILQEVYVANESSTARLVNASSRFYLAAEGSSAVIGFSIVGTSPKTVLVRAVGPTLATFGVTDSVTDPQLVLMDHRGVALAANVHWSTSYDSNAIISAAMRSGAFSLPPYSDDAAILATLPPGNYTALVSTAHSGTVLSELYEVRQN
jgi:probable HAF family extracellular repeat protein